MSQYEWAHGTITIPDTNWIPFRTRLLAIWNANQIDLFNDAKAAYEKVVQNPNNSAHEIIAAHCGGSYDPHYNSFDHIGWRQIAGRQVAERASERYSEICRLILPYVDGKATLQPPNPEDLHVFDETDDATIELIVATISFRNKNRTVTYEVHENNHAVRTAAQHWFVKEFFRALNQIQWTPGSGGTIVGNDEYNREARHHGGGGNSTILSFGPKN